MRDDGLVLLVIGRYEVYVRGVTAEFRYFRECFGVTIKFRILIIRGSVIFFFYGL